ncbi:hypothetical protein Pelo_16351 [Pelomyxa schiedti]|nr:hypothetical protein Pelo_16351 [Pelomyxa schiedti]
MAAVESWDTVAHKAHEDIKVAMNFKWKKVGEEQGVSIYSYNDGSSINYMRGQVKFEPGLTTTRKILDIVSGSDAKDYDPSRIEGIVKQEISKDDNGNCLEIVHLKYNSGSRFVSNRDFVCINYAVMNTAENSAVSLAKSVDAGIPPEPGFVRGETLGAFIIAPTPDGGQEVNYIVQLDPKGWVPTYLVNAVSRDQPMVLATLKAFISKH